MSHQRYIWNAFETILDGQVSASADVILLQSAQNLRSPGYLVIEPDVSEKREYISFTGVATNSLTGVVRGLSGGQAGVTHDSGKVVRAVVLHQFFDDLFTDIEALEATSAGHVGRSTGHPTVTRTAQGFMSGGDKTKLDGIEASAKGDQTAAQILASLLGVDGAGSKLDADLLDGIQAAGFTVIAHTGATGNAHGNASSGTAGFMSGADKSKLDGIPSGGGGSGSAQSASDIRNLGFFDTSNDGSGSGLDADRLDGIQASGFTVIGHTGARGNAHGSVTRNSAGFMSAADKTKLDGVATGATAGGGGGGAQSASDIRGLGFFTTTNDGSGSGLDADKLDGKHASDFSASSHAHGSLYYTETEVRALIDKLYGTDSAHGGRRVYIQSTQPLGKTDDLWIDTS